MDFLHRIGVILLITVFLSLSITGLRTNVDYSDPRYDEMLNRCIDSSNHKSRPGPEDELHKQCSPWKGRSCCTNATSHDAHYKKMYNFDWNHCSYKKPLSDKCRQHFVQDLCFYECSPNVGPWTVKVNNKFRKERFFKVPLCASDCDSWFQDCADDFTCTDNWTQNMEWVTGLGNKCPKNASCHTYREVYKTPKHFCETVWDHSWEVVEDNKHCMRLWFDPANGNPNDDVARWKATQIFRSTRSGSGGGGVGQGLTLTLPLILVTIVAMGSFLMR